MGGGEEGVEGRGGEGSGGRGETYVAKRNVLDQLGVDAGPLAHLLEQGVDHVLERGVLEAALAGLAQRGAGGEGDDDVVGVLGEPARCQWLVPADGRGEQEPEAMGETGAYTSSSPELGLMCLRIDPTRSVAMVSVFRGGICFQKKRLNY